MCYLLDSKLKIAIKLILFGSILQHNYIICLLSEEKYTNYLNVNDETFRDVYMEQINKYSKEDRTNGKKYLTIG